ncbi:MAG TPA: hypothetical protein VHO25_18150, partial [Polyangiaceae bacterium]|nr:hypothetical protein [Polyangiaceae bacterium]
LRGLSEPRHEAKALALRKKDREALSSTRSTATVVSEVLLREPAITAAPHPLWDDLERRERVVNAMWDQINRSLWSRKARNRPLASGCEPEPILTGSGISAEDVLVEAMEELHKLDPSTVRSWEGTAVTIAQRRAIDALRRAQAGLRGTPTRGRLKLVSGDQLVDPNEQDGPTRFDTLIASEADAENVYLDLVGARVLMDLGRELLSERDQQVYFGVHFLGKTKVELGEELDLTPQRVSQIAREAHKTLAADPRFPDLDDEKDTGGTYDDGK